MYNLSKAALAAAVIITLVSCGKDVEIASEGFGNEPIEFSTNIRPMLRATDDSWDSSDEIGIFAMPSGADISNSDFKNKEYYTSTRNGIFFPKGKDQAVTFPKEGSLDIIAYYPFAQGIDKTFPINITDQSSLAKIDLLYADGLKNINAKTPKKDIKLTFRHQLTKLHFEVGGMTDGLSMSMKGFETEADFNLADGKIANIRSKKDIKAHIAGTVCEAIIIPGTTGRNFVFEANGMTYNFKYNQAFEPGKIYNFVINLKGDGRLEVISMNGDIADWDNIDGGDIDLNEGEGDSAEDENLPDITIDNNATNIAFSTSDQVEKIIKLHAEGAWTISSSADWLTTNPSKGEGSKDITIKAEANSGAKRTARLTISSVKSLRTTGKQITITVVQEGRPEVQRIEFFKEGISKVKVNGSTKRDLFSKVYKDFVDNPDLVFSLNPDSKNMIRSTKVFDGHFWFLGGTEYTFMIEDIPTNSVNNDVILTFIGTAHNIKLFKKENIKAFVIDGGEERPLTIEGKEFVKGNFFQPFTAKIGKIKSDKITIKFVIDTTKSEKNNGFRLDNIILDGIK